MLQHTRVRVPSRKLYHQSYDRDYSDAFRNVAGSEKTSIFAKTLFGYLHLLAGSNDTVS